MIKFLDKVKKEDLKDKKVLLRVDFNVPLTSLPTGGFWLSAENKQVKIAGDFKIKASRETIDYLLENGAKILLVSHLDAANSFLPIAEEIGEILKQIISLVPHAELNSLDLLFQTSPVLLLDNIRQDSREEQNDEGLARSISKDFDFFVNDAFAVSHRRHALTAAVTKYLPSLGGFLMKKEIEHLSRALQGDPRGKVLVLGGAKISTKLPVIKNFLNKADKILVGGALANDFWQSQGVAVGNSLVDDSVKLTIESEKIILPTDILVSRDKTGRSDFYVSAVKNLNDDEAIVDIGPRSAESFAEIIRNNETAIWNGPMGLSEAEKFANGTAVVAKAVAGAKHSLVGGGETIAAAAKLDLLDKFSYVSTGGGAMLEFLAGRKLPGLEALRYYE